MKIEICGKKYRVEIGGQTAKIIYDAEIRAVYATDGYVVKIDHRIKDAPVSFVNHCGHEIRRWLRWKDKAICFDGHLLPVARHLCPILNWGQLQPKISWLLSPRLIEVDDDKNVDYRAMVAIARKLKLQDVVNENYSGSYIFWDQYGLTPNGIPQIWDYAY